MNWLTKFGGRKFLGFDIIVLVYFISLLLDKPVNLELLTVLFGILVGGNVGTKFVTKNGTPNA